MPETARRAQGRPEPPEPPKTREAPHPPNFHIRTQHGEPSTQALPCATDRIDMSVLHYAVMMEMFALKVVERDRERPFGGDDEIQDFACAYAMGMVRANLKNGSARKTKAP